MLLVGKGPPLTMRIDGHEAQLKRPNLYKCKEERG